MARVFIPAQWRDLTGGVAEVEVEANSLREVILALDSQFVGLAERACENGSIASSLAVSIDGALTSRGMLAKVEPASEIHFLPAIGGG
jgi:molybdopterin synthase sulfur carrier subunit